MAAMSVAFWILIATAHSVSYTPFLRRERTGFETGEFQNFRQAMCLAGDLWLSNTGVGVAGGGVLREVAGSRLLSFSATLSLMGFCLSVTCSEKYEAISRAMQKPHPLTWDCLFTEGLPLSILHTSGLSLCQILHQPLKNNNKKQAIYGVIYRLLAPVGPGDTGENTTPVLNKPTTALV